MNLEKLTEERERLQAAHQLLANRRKAAEERLKAIGEEYPEKMLQFATGELSAKALNALSLESAMLAGIIAEPLDKAFKLIQSRLGEVNRRRQHIIDAQTDEANHQEFKRLFNKILSQQCFLQGEHYQLQSLAKLIAVDHREAGASLVELVDRLNREIIAFKSSGCSESAFSDYVKVPAFPVDSVETAGELSA